jgi:ribulose-phosphate 3-epimerase
MGVKRSPIVQATTADQVLIAPSILSADFGRLAEQVVDVAEQGADWIHVDVMDGHFVPNITIGPGVVKALRQATDLPLDVHLMIENPERYIEAFVSAGADIVTVHVEACVHLQRTLSMIRQSGALAGVALNPHTHESALTYLRDDVDLVLAMTVNPGFGGQSLVPAVVEKVRRIARWIQDAQHPIALEVDGGVHPGTIQAVVEAGAHVAVAGSAVFGRPPYREAMLALRQAAGSSDVSTV